MKNRWFSHFQNYITSVDEKKYEDVSSYIKILDSSVRLSNQCIFVVDYFTCDVPYRFYNKYSLCGLNPEFLKHELAVDSLGELMTESITDVICEKILCWFSFLENRDISERTMYNLSFDVEIRKRLLNINFTPVFLCNEGKPWILIGLLKLSNQKELSNPVSIKQSSDVYWEYTGYNRWVEKERVKLSDIEKEILLMSIQGKKEDEIMIEISKTKDSLKSIKRRLFKKMDVNNITEAVSVAISMGLI